jgi:hypothetical protein
VVGPSFHRLPDVAAPVVGSEPQRRVWAPMQTFNHILAGTIAGVSGIVAGQPFDTIKVRLQTSQKGAYLGPVDCALKIARCGVAACALCVVVQLRRARGGGWLRALQPHSAVRKLVGYPALCTLPLHDGGDIGALRQE